MQILQINVFENPIPSNLLLKRDDSSTSSTSTSPSSTITSSDSSASSTSTGCPVLGDCVCPNKDEQCVQVAATESRCAYNKCTKIASSLKLNTGGVVGGVIGGVAFIALVALFLYYFLIYRKKHPLELDETYDYDYEYGDEYYDDDTLDVDGVGMGANGLHGGSGAGGGGSGDQMSEIALKRLNSDRKILQRTDFDQLSRDDGSNGDTRTIGEKNLSPTSGKFNTNSNGAMGALGASGATGATGATGAMRATGVTTTPSAAGIASQHPRPHPQMRRGVVNNPRKNMRRVSSYESFTKPSAIKLKSKQQQILMAQQRRARQKKIIQQANQQLHQLQQQQQLQQSQQQSHLGPNGPSGVDDIYMQPSNRNSVATSFSNASNILPIAYIAGVTVRPTQKNTQSLYSYDSDSIFSDLNTIENASIVNDVVMVGNNPKQSNVDTHEPPSLHTSQGQQISGPATMTAIKAQPRLVNVDRIEEEEEEEEEEDYEDDNDYNDFEGGEVVEGHYGQNFGNRGTVQGSQNIIPVRINTVTAGNGAVDTDDSDVDSDIGEITRATSVRRTTNSASNASKDTLKNNSLQNSNSTMYNREVIMGASGSDDNDTNSASYPSMGMMSYNENRDRESTRVRDSALDRDNGSTVGSFLFDVEFDETPQILAPKRVLSNLEDDFEDDAALRSSPFADP